MKTLLNTLFFLLLITQICFAQPVSPSANQSGWFWQNPLPCGNTLNDVCLVNENVATAVGEAGTIIRTTDGGETWSIQSSGTTLTLNSVCFVDADEGWVAGGDAPWMEDVSSIILHTTNGGKIWTTQNSGTNMPLNDVCFIDADIGTAVGGYYNGDNNDGIILGTTDGGRIGESNSAMLDRNTISLPQYHSLMLQRELLQVLTEGFSKQPIAAIVGSV